jgi:ADP-ribosylglycohydrolase
MALPQRSIMELEKLAMESRELEKKALELHHKAQKLNQLGLYDEAKSAYEEMHRVEDLSLSLAMEAGCTDCILGSDKRSEVNSKISGWNEAYESRHIPTPWSSLSPSPPGPPPHIIRERAYGCILSSLTADAAATGVHWIYDMALLSSIEEELQGPRFEFLDPPCSPFYSYAVGRNSPYGEQTLVLIESLSRMGGLDCTDYISTFTSAFSDGFEGYRDASTKGTMRNYSLGVLPPGANDAQANAVARLAPLVAMFCGDPKLHLMIEVSTRCTQNTDAACAWGLAGAMVLERLLLDPHADLSSLPVKRACIATIDELNASDAFGLGRSIALELTRAVEMSHIDPMEASKVLGNNCHMPNALTSPLQIALHLESSVDGQEDPREVFRRGIRAALRCGGCCASRSSYLGAVLGILLAPMVDREWLARVRGGQELHSKVEIIVASRD